jgi:hypothetical protein
MASRKLVESLLGVAGIWLLLRQIPDYATTLLLVATGEVREPGVGPSMLAFQSLHFAASVLTGFALLFARKSLAKWLHPGDSESSVQAQPVLAFGVTLLGLYFFIAGILKVAEYFARRATVSVEPYLLWVGIASSVLGTLMFMACPWVVRASRALTGEVNRVV